MASDSVCHTAPALLRMDCSIYIWVFLSAVEPCDWSQFADAKPRPLLCAIETHESKTIWMDGVALLDGLDITNFAVGHPYNIFYL